jgi:hypothetical protein
MPNQIVEAATPVLTPMQAAPLLQVHCGTLAAWRGRGVGPAFIVVSPGVIRYRLADINAYLDRMTVTDGKSSEPIRRRRPGPGRPSKKTRKRLRSSR